MNSSAGLNQVSRRSHRSAEFLCVLALLSLAIGACGGGSSKNSSGSGNGTTPPSNLVYPQTSINASEEFPITVDTPTVTGAVTGYSVSPALPAGLTMNSVTGAISGTPTALAAQANYTVTASNSGGSTTATLKIGVSLTAPDKLIYPQTSINATTGVAIQSDTPSVEGVVTSYSVNPALPAGLSINTSTGTITGTPTAAAAQATYVITAANSVGSTSASVQIIVTLAAPTNLIYPQTTINAKTGTAISPDVPTVTGLVTFFSVSPALPAGLMLNTSTGAISGTPTTASAQAIYILTASNSSGSTTASLQIAVALSAPSNLIYPTTTINATVGTAIAADTPTVIGTIAGYSVSPALPAGLVLDTSTGAISGTPTNASAQASYTLTASNSAGSTTAKLQITVAQEPAPSNLVYQQMTIVATVGIAIVADTPTISGTVSEYSIAPALPAGLSLNVSTGAISGTPTTASASASYTVTAQNAGGSATTRVTIAVGSPIVLYQGPHQAAVTSLHSNANRLLSTDAGGAWALWDYSSGAGPLIAQGAGVSQPISPNVDLEGQIFAVNAGGTVQVYSAIDGTLIFTVPKVVSFAMPADGSYICTVSSSQLTIWSPSGMSEVVRPANYSSAYIFAASGQVQVALGPAGQNVIESIDVASGTSTVSPAFLGTFNLWFADGSKFITTSPNGSWVYSNAGVQLAGGALPQNVHSWDGGVGNQIWTTGYNTGTGDDFAVFSVGAAAPSHLFQLPSNSSALSVSGSILWGYIRNTAQIFVIDLSGATPTLTNYTLPSSFENSLLAYTTNESGEWSVGNSFGVVMDATNLSSPGYFDHGEVLGIAAGGNTAAIATGNAILLYDLTTAQQTGIIPFVAGTPYMQMSSDGTVLAVLGFAGETYGPSYTTNQVFNVYSLPSRGLLQTNSYTYAQPGGGTGMMHFSLSASGTALAQSFQDYSALGLQQVTGVSGSPLIWSSTGSDDAVYLSPDGTSFGAEAGLAETEVYKNATKIGSTYGAVGFIDNDNLLVETTLNVGGSLAFDGYAIYNIPSGTITRNLPRNTIPDILDYSLEPLTNVPIPQLAPLPQFPSANSVYWSVTDAIYSLADGSVIWQGPALNWPFTAIAGSNLIYYANGQAQMIQIPLN